MHTYDRVIDGADTTLESMEKVPVNEKNRPLKEIKLLSVRVLTRSGSSSRSSNTALLGQVTVHANPIADAAK
jgi:hypothetical protein